MSKNILVIDDSKMVLKVVRATLDHESDFNAFYAETAAEARAIVEEKGDAIFAALVDYNLPDATEGELIDYLLEKKIPSIVLTASFNEQRRNKLLKKGIVDYVLKEGKFSYQYAVKLIERIWKNQNIDVLVVDDSETSLNHICNLLNLYLFRVHRAMDGVEALAKIEETPGIKLVITDYNMPEMDGFTLIQHLREKKNEDMVIIGLSSEGKESLTAKFIKNGASDFIRKPFNREEFQVRVLRNVESQEYVELMRSTANRDFLTNCYNRRYFFNEGSALYHQAKKQNEPIATAVIDVDFFKNVNDTYGHDAGDKVLKFLGNKLNKLLSRFLVARAGGEEFFILMPGLSNEQARTALDRFRELISSSEVNIGNQMIKISFSAGVTNELQEDLDEQLKRADEYLYKAKEAGRNCVIGD